MHKSNDIRVPASSVALRAFPLNMGARLLCFVAYSAFETLFNYSSSSGESSLPNDQLLESPKSDGIDDQLPLSEEAQLEVRALKVPMSLCEELRAKLGALPPSLPEDKLDQNLQSVTPRGLGESSTHDPAESGDASRERRLMPGESGVSGDSCTGVKDLESASLVSTQLARGVSGQADLHPRGGDMR